MRFVCTISLSLLETRENTFGFLFSSRNWRKYLKFLHFFCKSSRSLLEPENRSRHFSFLFSKLEMWIPYFSFSSRFDFLASRQCLYDTLSYLLITMIKCLKGHNSLESLYDEGLLKSICHCHCVCFCLFVGWFISLHYSERSQVSLFEGDQLGEPSNRTIGKIWSFVPTRSTPTPLPVSWDTQN